HHHHPHHRMYVHRHWPSFHRGWGYRTHAPYAGYWWPRSVGVTVYDDDFIDGSGRGRYAANGLLLGTLAGAVIGNNSGDLHNNAWLGAGLGAAAGYVAGSIAENRAERSEKME